MCMCVPSNDYIFDHFIFVGVYFSKNAMFSINNYSQASNHYWQNSALQVHRCVAMAEIINLPSQFVSSSPHFVVANTEWIVW